MIPEWIIEEEKKREERIREIERQRPQLDVPMWPDDWRPTPPEEKKEEPRVIEIQIW